MWKGCDNYHGIYTHKIIWQTLDSVLVPLELIPFDPNKSNRAIKHVNVNVVLFEREVSPVSQCWQYINASTLHVCKSL